MKRNAHSSGSLVQMDGGGGGRLSPGYGASARASTSPQKNIYRASTASRTSRLHSDSTGGKSRHHSDSVDSSSSSPHSPVHLQGVMAGWYDEWKSVQQAIVSLFEGKQLTEKELNEVCQTTKQIVDSEMGPFVYDYYKNNILTKAMSVLLDEFDRSADELVVKSLERAWLTCYHQIIPVIQVIMRPVAHPSDKMTCRRTAGLVFRDHVVFPSGLESIITGSKHYKPSPTIKQMLLVLMLLKEEGPPSENYLRLEAMTACVVTPFLGVRGLYIDGRLVAPAALDLQPHELPELHHLHSRPMSIHSSSPSLNKQTRLQFRRQQSHGELLQKVDEAVFLPPQPLSLDLERNVEI